MLLGLAVRAPVTAMSAGKPVIPSSPLPGASLYTMTGRQPEATFNIGLRWEFETPLEDVTTAASVASTPPWRRALKPRSRGLRHNPTPEVPVSQFNAKGGLLFAGVGGQPNGLYSTPKMNLMPRFGLAYQITDKTVMRAGIGTFYGFLGQRRGDVNTLGFSRNTDFIATNDNINFVNRLSNPLPVDNCLSRSAQASAF